MYGKDNSPIPSHLSIQEIRLQARQNSELFKQKLKFKFDKKHPDHPFKINDFVKKIVPDNHSPLNKPSNLYNGPYQIAHLINPKTVVLTDPDDPDFATTASVDQLQPYIVRVLPSAGECDE